ncbi:manganese efflux pump MntP family protein [Ruminococcus sp.]|uniref:manganese efflux pump MntP n=1 Tax=Ruminococcus sp. TaxID=41978 RepID=UPI0025CF9252|nr:manganese efflux pump MntP family protein [Ruminococcus sp.]MBQ6169359.1 manganese efflux pump [Ruminococcus sp.]MBR1430273.1 manganese efflux pump [Ruminococcus sp.]
MGITELLLISVGLAMDAFSVSVCKGLSMKKLDLKGGVITALFFGAFQAFMPVIGYFLGSRFADFISSFSHWVSFGLLAVIGGKMMIEAIKGGDDESENEYRLNIKELFVLAVATSIDALAVGIVFAAEKTPVITSVTIIGAVTFLLSLAGVYIGHRFGSKYEKKAELAGGAILIIIGVKLLLEGLGVI